MFRIVYSNCKKQKLHNSRSSLVLSYKWNFTHHYLSIHSLRKKAYGILINVHLSPATNLYLLTDFHKTYYEHHERQSPLSKSFNAVFLVDCPRRKFLKIKPWRFKDWFCPGFEIIKETYNLGSSRLPIGISPF